MSASMLRPSLSDEPPVSAPASLAVVAERLEKSYEMRPVLRGVSFTLAAGRTLALLGPNGAGKTTVLRVLATLTKPSGGTAQVAGVDVLRDANAVRRLVGYVGHAPLLYDDLTAEENLRFFATMFGVREKGRVAELLALVGLRAKARERVRALSRGQAQRLALARGIVHDPAVLLLDEPDTGLDEQGLEVLAAILRERRAAGQTTVLTTHALSRGLAQADEVLLLAGGRVAHAGSASGLDADAVRVLLAVAARPGARKGGAR